MEYDFRRIEKEWQQKWTASGAYKVSNDSAKPKYYVLDMFPYPSGAGLHVGHPLGYIASDIFARYKRLKGFNVLHPMGYDAFGLPAEQYAIEHGIHPAVSTDQNIQNFRRQLDNIGFSFDWSREVRTSDAGYYKWTQWIFLQLFDSWFNRSKNAAERISTLIAIFEKEGNINHPCPGDAGIQFNATQWKAYDEASKMNVLMEYRLAYCGIGEVNWCEALGTVLANDEVINGVSERGGYPVVKKKLRQWYLRITEYADRLLEGLERIEFSESMREMQTNWIGKSYGAEIDFKISLTPSRDAGHPSPGGEGGSGRHFQTADKSLWGILKDHSRSNRKQATEAEGILWEHVRNNKLGFKVRRQHVIGGFITDFAFMQQRIIVEIDGGYHENEEQRQYDEARTQFLKEAGYTVLRFTNEEVLSNIEEVIKKIQQSLTGAPLLREEKRPGDEAVLRVYTTRPDTIFGVDFMVVAPEHELIEQITTADQKQAVDDYIAYVKSRSERERMAEKKITGVFTGAYALNPFDEDRKIPIWISEYVLAGYGTGAIMAVPCGDERDHKFAKHFNIPITDIIGKYYDGQEANPTKDATLENSGFLNGMVMREAIEVVINKLDEMNIGTRKVNYKMRDAAFSRQRYWGEPFPIVWKDNVAYPLPESELPVLLPHMDELKPGPDAEGPLSNLTDWKNYNGGIREVNTMPGYAGSSWYFLRYMDPQNDKAFCDRKVSDYWGQVDLYIGGTEHAVGHLLYSRMWTKALYDLGYIGHDEPYKKLVNQGMIQGSSRFVYRVDSVSTKGTAIKMADFPVFISAGYYEKFEKGILSGSDLVHLVNRYSHYFDSNENSDYSTITVSPIHVDVSFVDGVEMNIEAFKKWKAEYAHAEFILEDGKYICGTEVEKMSKRYFNVVNPNDIVDKYGADTFRMYEMFLGPVEQSKPWETKGIEGVHRFIKKLWRLFYDEVKGKIWNTEKATPEELKVLHKAIKKIEEDTERFSFNTAVSAFMICINELNDLKCSKKEILEPVLILLTPYAPHVCEELWSLLGNTGSILDAAYPAFEGKYLVESTKEYPISVNGKLRTTINIALDAQQDAVEQIVLSNEVIQKWMEGKPHKRIIYVKGKMVNVVV